jgi:hypothetical protein
MRQVKASELKSLIGKTIYAVKKDGARVSGKLVKISGSRLYVKPAGKGKIVKTKAIVPLVLYDLLAIGTAPYAYGYPGYAPYGAYGSYGAYPGYGYPGYFW